MYPWSIFGVHESSIVASVLDSGILNLMEHVMTTFTFDTLKFVERLMAGGVPEAEALVAAFSEAMDSQLATKSDINRLDRELPVIKWMVGLVLGGYFDLNSQGVFSGLTNQWKP
jgi:hypothetical protein